MDTPGSKEQRSWSKISIDQRAINMSAQGARRLLTSAQEQKKILIKNWQQGTTAQGTRSSLTSTKEQKGKISTRIGNRMPKEGVNWLGLESSKEIKGSFL